MTTLVLSDYDCHSEIIDGCVKYVVRHRFGETIAVMKDRQKAVDYTRELQQEHDKLVWGREKRNDKP